MSHTAVLGDVELPVTYSKDEAIALMQEDGIVGAGGAGFPTHIKWQNPTSALLVNCAESEPGYYSDKLLLRDEPEAFVDVFEWLRATFSLDAILVGAEDVAKPYMHEMEELASRLKDFSISYFEPKYKYGQEKALCEVMMGLHLGQKEIPPQRGIIVQNDETLFNMYRAMFRARPVTTKFLQVYGEIGPPKVFEAPIGTIAADLLRLYGIEPADYGHCKLYDGGPILADCVAEKMGSEPEYAITKTTNGLLVVHPEKDRPRKAHYPSPEYEHNTIDAPWAASEIINVEKDVHRVRVPMRGRFWTTGRLLVKEGDHVSRKDDLAMPADGGRSIGVHASIDGKVTRITDDYVEIVS